ncbi:MAG: CoA transferase subunit A [Mesorhizobium sp.]|nr:CoA transferase subunit A [Mesorhizobium sp.]MBL8579077.1 CoA transferase subunit A [Mesorhizobium sp.]
MPLPDKTCGMEEAISRIVDGATVMVGGFGVPGTPFSLIRELVRQGQKDLVIVKNDANEVGMGVDWLLANGQVRKLIASHIGLNGNAVSMMNSGKIEVEFVPQGLLAERIRAAGAGLLGVVSDIVLDAPSASGKTTVMVDGMRGILEPAIRADFALVHAERSDRFGNLCFAASARNFNPLVCMAARHTIVEAETILPVGAIAPETVHTPGPFVDAVVAIPELLGVYGVVER